MTFLSKIRTHYKIVAAPTKVILSDYVDVKDFRQLMDKHNIKILSENKTPEGFMFEVAGDQEVVEGLLIETHMEWEFG